MDTLTVSEVFGPTVQGEGPSAGQRAMFLRLGRCNLTCRWCDTAYTWDWRGLNGVAYDPRLELHDETLSTLSSQLMHSGVELVVVTGGEPLLQQRTLARLARALVLGGYRVEVETNGTLAPGDELVEYVELFVVSPKLAHAGMMPSQRIRPDVLRRFEDVGGAVLKFVVTTPQDLDECDRVRRHAPELPAWVMPEGRDAKTLDVRMRLLAGEAIRRGYHVSDRLHVRLWGDQRAH